VAQTSGSLEAISLNQAGPYYGRIMFTITLVDTKRKTTHDFTTTRLSINKCLVKQQSLDYTMAGQEKHRNNVAVVNKRKLPASHNQYTF
jgi:hypothetical protein